MLQQKKKPSDCIAQIVFTFLFRFGLYIKIDLTMIFILCVIDLYLHHLKKSSWIKKNKNCEIDSKI